MAKSKKPLVMTAKFLRDAVGARLDDAGGLEMYPILMECLMPCFEAGKLIRSPGRITLTAEGAHWRVKLDCPTEILSTTMAAGTLVDILGALELYLSSGAAVWSPGWKKSKNALPTVDDVI